MRNVRFFLSSLLPSCSSDFDDLASTPTPPEWRQGPVGTTRASRPAFLGEQKDLQQRWVDLWIFNLMFSKIIFKYIVYILHSKLKKKKEFFPQKHPIKQYIIIN